MVPQLLHIAFSSRGYRTYWQKHGLNFIGVVFSLYVSDREQVHTALDIITVTNVTFECNEPCGLITLLTLQEAYQLRFQRCNLLLRPNEIFTGIR
jgi:hypothetical protein